MKKSTFINEEMLEPYVCNEIYSSTMILGDELVGEPCININRGNIAAHQRLGGGVHEKAEIYYVVDCAPGAEIVTGTGRDGDEEIHYKVKAGDTVFIPGGVFHWVDNRMCSEVFKLMTIWPNQELNEMYFSRLENWGTSFKFKNGEN